MNNKREHDYIEDSLNEFWIPFYAIFWILGVSGFIYNSFI